MKQVSPQAIHFDSLFRSSHYGAMSEEDQDEFFNRVIASSSELPPSQDLSHEGFGDGCLYSFCPYGEHANTIVVTHIDTSTVTWFRPELPEHDLELTTVLT